MDVPNHFEKIKKDSIQSIESSLFYKQFSA